MVCSAYVALMQLLPLTATTPTSDGAADPLVAARIRKAVRYSSTTAF